MTTTRTSTSARRSFRGAALVLFTGAGIALTPLTASAAAGDPAPVASAPVSLAAAPVAAPNSAAQAAVDTALAQQGDPYKWGATGPNAFDCSGLTSFAYKAAGVDAIFPGAHNPFERRFRDMHTLSQQIQSRASHFEAVGQILLGDPPKGFL